MINAVEMSLEMSTVPRRRVGGDQSRRGPGFHVRGLNPSAPEGELFRALPANWHPLWECCQTLSKTAARVEHGHAPVRDGLGADDARRLAADLRRAERNGLAKEFREFWEEVSASSPAFKPYDFRPETLKMFARFLDACGGFEVTWTP
jgi:hypothetical protein